MVANSQSKNCSKMQRTRFFKEDEPDLDGLRRALHNDGSDPSAAEIRRLRSLESLLGILRRA